MNETNAESWEFAEPISCTCGHRASLHNIIDGCTKYNCGCTKGYQEAFDAGKIAELKATLDEAKEYLTQLLWVADDDGIHCGICHSEEYAAGKHEPDCPAAILLAKLKGK